MSAHPRHRLVALLLSIVPGWGHVYWGREILGLGIFTACAVLGFVFLNAKLIYRGEGRDAILWISGALSLLAFGAAFIDLALRTSPPRVRREQEARERLLHQGTIAYLKRDYDNAVVLFRECLRIDPQDVDALFRLGVAFARRGDADQARRWLRNAIRLDLDEKWHWEAQREIALLESEKERSEASDASRRQVDEQEESQTATA
ncbi:MAG: tetratricopeptide repeat protein [Planctomycetes bacterium]|nr:tetratricopeptide repeat protein [Planctomycetota bacterium]